MTDRIARTLPIAALCAVSALMLASCGGGGGKKAAPTPPDEMQVMPAVDHPDTLGEALAIAAGQTVDGRIDSAEDRDFFRLPLTEASTVTFWTSGEADTLVALLDGEGNDLAADTDGRASVETELSNVYARVRGGPDGGTGGYRLHNEVVARAGGNGSPEEVMGNLNHCLGEFRFYHEESRLPPDSDVTIREARDATCYPSGGLYRDLVAYSFGFTNQCNSTIGVVMAWNISDAGPYRYFAASNIQPGAVWNAVERTGREGLPVLERHTANWPSISCIVPPTSIVYCVEDDDDDLSGSWDYQRPPNPEIGSIGLPRGYVQVGAVLSQPSFYGRCHEQGRANARDPRDDLNHWQESPYLHFVYDNGRRPPMPRYREIRAGDWMDADLTTSFAVQ